MHKKIADKKNHREVAMKFPINTLVFFAFFGIETKFVQAGTTMPNWPVSHLFLLGELCEGKLL